SGPPGGPGEGGGDAGGGSLRRGCDVHAGVAASSAGGVCLGPGVWGGGEV
ncbi:MAG: hypothetical protein HWN79_18845, partial [Candidatus Lokiarchaeota archaeon]|nr:hypothetical protein [Candidatus Lokiarchaeota archaeon]